MHSYRPTTQVTRARNLQRNLHWVEQVRAIRSLPIQAGITADFINNRLAILHTTLFVESNPIPVKWALYEMGLIPAGIRLPLTPLAEQHRETVRQALRQAGVLGQ